jgi:hypothetical protein
MPIFKDDKLDMLVVEFGSGDIGITGGFLKNYPCEDNKSYERRTLLEIRQLAEKGSLHEPISEEQAKKERELPPAIVFTFPTDGQSIDNLIKILTEIKKTGKNQV